MSETTYELPPDVALVITFLALMTSPDVHALIGITPEGQQELDDLIPPSSHRNLLNQLARTPGLIDAYRAQGPDIGRVVAGLSPWLTLAALVQHRPALQAVARQVRQQEHPGEDAEADKRLTDQLVAAVSEARDVLALNGLPSGWNYLDGTRYLVPNTTGHSTDIYKPARGPYGDLLDLDARAAAFVSQLGTNGGELADAIHKNAAKRWQSYQQGAAAQLFALWHPRGPKDFVNNFAESLCRVLWLDVVRPQLDAERVKPAALVSVVHSDVVSLLRPGRTLQDRHLTDRDGRQLMLMERLSQLDVPTVEMSAIPRLLQKGVELLGSIHAHRIVRHLVTSGHRRVLGGDADARALRYSGGWASVADHAGVVRQEDARAIVVALAHSPFFGPNNSVGNLLSYTWHPHAPGRSSLVTIILGDMLLPHFVHAITGKTRTVMEARQLVPVVDLPGLVGRQNDHGAQAALQMLVLAEMRRRAVELAERGSVRIAADRWQELAQLAGLGNRRKDGRADGASLLERVLERWTRDGNDAPAFLSRVTPDRWTLAPSYKAALEFMAAAGHDSARASVAGHASVRKAYARRKIHK